MNPPETTPDRHRQIRGGLIGSVTDALLGSIWSSSAGRRLVQTAVSRLHGRVERLRVLGTAGIPASASPEQRDRELASRLELGSEVWAGPFKGLKYPSLEAAGSSLLPKLLGCYESELHLMLEHLYDRNPTSIVDVGCAEGYYAVGSAMRCPAVPVFAFDTAPRARELCARMAQINGVEQRVSVRGECTPAVLRQLAMGGHALIIVDCEGYEAELLDDSMPAPLRSHAIIVECHEFIVPGITETLTRRFAATHRLLHVSTIPDLERAEVIGLPQLAGLSATDRLMAVAENRPGRMGWLVMVPRPS